MKTIATALILSFALIGAAQATPRGDSDNEPFQGVAGSGQYPVDNQNPQALRTPQLPADQQSQQTWGDSNNLPYQAMPSTGSGMGSAG